MKLILQRVTSASVYVDTEKIANIDKGILVFFGAEKGDGKNQACFLVEKTLNLRIFPDDSGKMNFSCVDVRGDILVVPQFTLLETARVVDAPGLIGRQILILLGHFTNIMSNY